MIITYIGMASIFLGFLCVMGAFWLFHNREDRRGPIVLGLLAILFHHSGDCCCVFRRNDHWLDFFSPVICGTVVGLLDATYPPAASAKVMQPKTTRP